MLYTFMHQSPTSTYVPNFVEIEEIFCRRTDGHLGPVLLGRLGGRSRPKNINCSVHTHRRVDYRAWRIDLRRNVTLFSYGAVGMFAF